MRETIIVVWFVATMMWPGVLTALFPGSETADGLARSGFAVSGWVGFGLLAWGMVRLLDLWSEGRA